MQGEAEGRAWVNYIVDVMYRPLTSQEDTCIGAGDVEEIVFSAALRVQRAPALCAFMPASPVDVQFRSATRREGRSLVEARFWRLGPLKVQCPLTVQRLSQKSAQNTLTVPCFVLSIFGSQLFWFGFIGPDGTLNCHGQVAAVRAARGEFWRLGISTKACNDLRSEPGSARDDPRVSEAFHTTGLPRVWYPDYWEGTVMVTFLRRRVSLFVVNLEEVTCLVSPGFEELLLRVSEERPCRLPFPRFLGCILALSRHKHAPGTGRVLASVEWPGVASLNVSDAASAAAARWKAFPPLLSTPSPFGHH
ncbi:hypothetical protein BKA80DRAFT_251971 [Phyllosticta citrichinensis]